jgi:hypothetical protein
VSGSRRVGHVLVALLTAVLAVLCFSRAASSILDVPEDVEVSVAELQLRDDLFWPGRDPGHVARIREESVDADPPDQGIPCVGCTAAWACDGGPCRQVSSEARPKPPPLSLALLQVLRC